MTKRFVERRKHKRYSVNLPVVSRHDDDKIEMKTANVSLGGAYCHVDRYLPEMTRLALDIKVPGDGSDGEKDEWIEAEAVVVRVEPDRAGGEDYYIALFFTKMSEEDRKKLAEILS